MSTPTSRASRLTLKLRSVVLAALPTLFVPCPSSAAGLEQQQQPPSSAPCAAPIWKADTAYATGELVKHQGKTFRCVQGHTSLSTWAPDIVPALWAETAECAGQVPPTPPAQAQPAAPPARASASTPGATPLQTPPKIGGGATEYAPYFYTWGWGNPAYAFKSLVDLQAKSGLRGVTLAFVLASNGCNTSRDIHEHQADVNAFRKAGGRVKASFGGADGRYLESSCADAASMAKALDAFVDATGITDLDFDVEQAGAMTPEINQRRSEAFALLQKSKKTPNINVKISLTLAAFPRDRWGAPGGMSAPALAVLRSAFVAGVRIHRVNLMTMDYGPYYSAGRSMGELAETALIDANAQIRSLAPSLGVEEVFAMLGATPMIGTNDVAGEVFKIDDARALATFAKQKHLGLVSYWAINRDQACTSGLALCSGVNKAAFDFHNVLRTVE